MIEAGTKLVGYVDPLYPLGERIPEPVLALIHTRGRDYLSYPDCTLSPAIAIEDLAAQGGLQILEPDSQVPFRQGDFLYKVTSKHLILGDQDTVVRNLRLALDTITDPNTTRFINEFIESTKPGFQRH